MKEEEYLTLERLLGKLRGELGHQFCVCSNTHDSYTIAIYDNTTGELKDQHTTGTIKETVSTLNKRLQSDNDRLKADNLNHFQALKEWKADNDRLREVLSRPFRRL